jgi:hypothetical protein
LSWISESLADETSRESALLNLALALEAYPHWSSRLQQRNLLAAFLNQAVANVPFYRNLGPKTELLDFPVTSRGDHLRCGGDFQNSSFSDRRLRRLSDHTNGTLGPSLRVFLDLPSFFDSNYASFLRFIAVSPELRRRLLPHIPSIFVVSDSPSECHTSAVMPGLGYTVLKRLVLGRSPRTDVAIAMFLRKSNVVLLHGKPSVLVRLAHIDDQIGAGRISPSIIVCSGENLYQDDRSHLEQFMSCPTIDAYSASEVGLAGVECFERNGIHIISDHLIVEVLDTQSGEVGQTGSGELLVTNALNWRHTFIRYRIGDQATIVHGSCVCGHDGLSITDLPARDTTSYRQGDEQFKATEIGSAIQACQPPVKHFQVRSEGAQLVILWVAQDSRAAQATASSLSQVLTRRFPRLRFELQEVNVITPPGAKRLRYI